MTATRNRYTASKDLAQLLGSLTQDPVSAINCEPLNVINNTKINPCGLIANTLFNDVITLESIIGPDGEPIENAPMVETGIAWQSDLEWKFAQPDGFRYEECANCEVCDCEEVTQAGEKVWSCKKPYMDEDGVCFRYFYPEDDTTQYLYEVSVYFVCRGCVFSTISIAIHISFIHLFPFYQTYPMVVNPLEGVTNEHFVVWMRTAALPHFRKLYGYIQQPIPAGSTLTFRIMSNFAVERLEGAKALVVSNNYIFGGKNPWLGDLFITVGTVAAVLGALFLAKNTFAPRRMGDRMYLSVKDD